MTEPDPHYFIQCCGSGSGGSIINWPAETESGSVKIENYWVGSDPVLIPDTCYKKLNYLLVLHIWHNILFQWPKICTDRIRIWTYPPGSGSINQNYGRLTGIHCFPKTEKVVKRSHSQSLSDSERDVLANFKMICLSTISWKLRI